MPETQIAAACGSEESFPENTEKDLVDLPSETDDTLQHDKVMPSTTVSGDRALVLMDLENGMVGWESAEDPDNPQ
jgi:hypothetical protein